MDRRRHRWHDWSYCEWCSSQFCSNFRPSQNPPQQKPAPQKPAPRKPAPQKPPAALREVDLDHWDIGGAQVEDLHQGGAQLEDLLNNRETEPGMYFFLSTAIGQGIAAVGMLLWDI